MTELRKTHKSYIVNATIADYTFLAPWLIDVIEGNYFTDASDKAYISEIGTAPLKEGEKLVYPIVEFNQAIQPDEDKDSQYNLLYKVKGEDKWVYEDTEKPLRSLTNNQARLYRFIQTVKFHVPDLWEASEKEEFESRLQEYKENLDTEMIRVRYEEMLGQLHILQEEISKLQTGSDEYNDKNDEFQILEDLKEDLYHKLNTDPIERFHDLYEECLKELELEMAVGGTGLNINIISSAISGAEVEGLTAVGDDKTGKELQEKLSEKNIKIDRIDPIQKGVESTKSAIFQAVTAAKRVYGKFSGVDMDSAFSVDTTKEYVEHIKEYAYENPDKNVDFFMTLTLVGKTKNQEGLKYALEDLSKEPNVEFKTMASSNIKDSEKNKETFMELYKASNKVYGNEEEIASLLGVDKNDPQAIIEAFQEQIIKADPENQEVADAYKQRVESFGKPTGFISAGKLGAFVVEEDKIFRVSISGEVIKDEKDLYNLTDTEKKFLDNEKAHNKEHGIILYPNGCGDNATGAFDGAVKRGFSKEFASQVAMAMAQDCMKAPAAQAQDPKQVLANLIEKEADNLSLEDKEVADNFLAELKGKENKGSDVGEPNAKTRSIEILKERSELIKEHGRGAGYGI